MHGQFTGYRIIYITKKSDDGYLIRDISNKRSKPEYFKAEAELKIHGVYLHELSTNEFILMNPFVCFIQCKYHRRKELFVFSNKQFDEYTGKERAHYVGGSFMCSPLVPPIDGN